MKDRYMIVIEEGTLKTYPVPFEDGIEPLYRNIKCDAFDHSSAIDWLTERNLDLWVDDEGLLKNRFPVFVFADDNGNISGYLVGNIVIQKHNEEGESLGLSPEECEEVFEWLQDHRVFESVDSSHKAILIKWEESQNHRESIARTKKLFEEMGGTIIGG